MSEKKQENKRSFLSKEIRDFAEDVYDYVWSKHEFLTLGVTENFAEGYSMRNSSKKDSKITHFTESIGKAVRVTQYLLRDYFKPLIKFSNTEKSTFKKEIKLMWSHWLENRTNVFVKVIDTLAIIAEVFLYCDAFTSTNLELNEITEWFIEWFIEILESEFFRCGGWKPLKDLSHKWYDELFEKLKLEYYVSDIFEDEQSIYTCEVTEYLRSSPVEFPVPDSVLCEKCRLPTDKNLRRRIVYVKIANEFVYHGSEPKDGCDGNGRHLNFPSEVNTEAKLKDDHCALKTDFNKKSTTKEDFPFIAEPQIDKFQKNDITEISPKRLSSISDTVVATKTNFKTENNFKNVVDSCKKDLGNPDYKQCETSTTVLSQSRTDLPVPKDCLNEDNLDSFLSTEFSTQTLPKHLVRPYELLPDPKESSITPLDVRLSDEEETYKSSKAFLLNDSSDISAVALSSPASFPDSEQILTNEDFATKLSTNLQKWQPIKLFGQFPIVSNGSLVYPDVINTLHFEESVNYNAFIEILYNFLIRNDFQKDDEIDKYKFCLISETFCNSFKNMFEVYRNNSIKEKPCMNISDESEAREKVTETKNLKNVQSYADELDSLKIVAHDYSYYFFGGKKSSLSQKAKKKIKKPIKY